MPLYRVTGIVTWNFEAVVEADSPNDAEEYVSDGVYDGMWMGSYMPHDQEIHNIVEIHAAGDG